MPSPRLILASASPRRRSLLSEAGYTFDVHPADINEDDFPITILPGDLALRLARQKADAVAQRFPDAVVLAADTVVAFGDMILNKPRDAQHAGQMLALLAGTTHIVITGVAVRHLQADLAQEQRVMSAVRMRPLSKREIEDYVASGQWQGKAGGYGIQDQDPFVTRMSGSHSNIVGLPMTTTRKLLTAAGVTPKKIENEPQMGTDEHR
jgi:septum formation protein